MKEGFLEAKINIREWLKNNGKLRNIIENSEKIFIEENLVNHKTMFWVLSL